MRATTCAVDPPTRRSGVRIWTARPADGPGDDRRTTSEHDFAQIVNPVSSRLLRVARRILPSEDLAWEAVQEAFLSLWRRADPPVNTEAWLVSSVLHHSLHLARGLRRRRAHEAKASLARAESSPGDDPSHAVTNRELRRRILDAVERLTPAQRDVVVLFCVEGLDYAAIAERLSIPVGTVRSRLNRARATLRSELLGGDDAD